MRRFLFLSLGVLVVAFSLNGIGADHHCPWDWFSFDRFCYKVIKQRKNWQDAERFCGQLQNGSHLASIQSWAESKYVAMLLSNNAFLDTVWIGLFEPEKNRSLEWSDGSGFCYTGWERRKRNNVDNKKYCVELSWMSDYLEWNNVKCESRNIFICKI
uniref:C-type lectin lectoxin-Lei1 n=1 Tax=Leioheterodon madagascariensis TaxID=46577 RepID=LEC1_LEIMD|nr:RecName: Full=C-type lectin lectoxin-Lei1; Short=CTL; Flags: Precursor [Leioheterodon madagascariensis]ABU68499.1 Lectoxin-Lei1 [Leioheterodon madagascariensis]